MHKAGKCELRQWKNFKYMRRILVFWPELFDLDNLKPLTVGGLDDIQQDIAARNLVIGAGALKAALYASYPVQKSAGGWWCLL